MRLYWGWTTRMLGPIRDEIPNTFYACNNRSKFVGYLINMASSSKLIINKHNCLRITVYRKPTNRIEMHQLPLVILNTNHITLPTTNHIDQSINAFVCISNRHWTRKTSAQCVETSVTTNSPSQDSFTWTIKSIKVCKSSIFQQELCSFCLKIPFGETE